MNDGNGRQLSPGWCWASLEDVTELIAGNPAPQGAENFNATGIPFVRVQDMGRLGSRIRLVNTKDHLTKAAARDLRLFPAGAVLFTKSGASTLLNQRAILWRPMCVVSHIAVALPENGVLSEWLHFWLSTVDFAHYAHATTLPSLPLSKIRKIALPVAPTAEQRRIADTLDELFASLNTGVAALERARDKLTRYRASVLKAAVEGALTADWREQHPDAEPASALLKRTLIERRRRWEQDQLRTFAEKGKTPPKHWQAKYKEPVAPDTASLPPLPAGWYWVSLEDVTKLIAGNPAPQGAENFDATGIPFVRVQDMGRLGSRIRLVNTKDHLTKAAARDLRLFPAGAVLFTKSGASTLLNQRAILQRPMCVVSHIAVALPENGVLSEWLHFWLSTVDFAHYAHATTLPSLPLSKIRKIALPLPPFEEQKAIVEAVEEQLSVVERLEADINAKLKAAQHLRQSILRHAFSSKLVAHDPHDEPASALLKRIAAERKARRRV